ncbi:peptide deformylase [Candidatus Shapirobacteria bacterium]|nr:MAG: peptide deformylase [Candidatus Shapirobacteria bacterium]
MRQIVIYPSKILRQKSQEVLKVDKKLKQEIEEVEEVLRKTDNGAGLPAIQIGIKKRFFMMSKKRGMVINPKIIKTIGKKTYLKIEKGDLSEEDFLEGCLSVPDFFGTVKRWAKIEAEWAELKGEELRKKTEVLEGFEAVIFQHELDHLNGILFIDHIKRDGGKLYKSVAGKMIEWKVESVL